MFEILKAGEGFNPYSNGFSSFIKETVYLKANNDLLFNPYSNGFSSFIVLKIDDNDFIEVFNPYSNGFSSFM